MLTRSLDIADLLFRIKIQPTNDFSIVDVTGHLRNDTILGLDSNALQAPAKTS